MNFFAGLLIGLVVGFAIGILIAYLKKAEVFIKDVRNKITK
jgi:uncharacterized membrane-anchored protein YhcB (DUF1043 family)